MLRAILHGRTESESTVTINCHAIRFVRSHLPLLPLCFFFSAAATAAVVVMVSFLCLFLATHTAKRSLLLDNQCPRPSVQGQARGLAFAPGGNATNNAMSIPTALTCFRSRGGHLIIGRTAILWQLLSLSSLPSSPLLFPLPLLLSSLPSPSPSPSLSLQVAVIVTRTINFLQFLLCRMFFCNRKQVTVNNAYVHGQKVVGRANQRLGKLLVGLPEDLHFRAIFGVSAEVAVEAWEMMVDHSCLPPNPSSSIICGQLHLLCKRTLQTTPL
jgi:hypothetical protein